MSVDVVRVSPGWLALREPADAAARAGGLIGRLRGALPADRPLVIHDLGGGTGSMGRWLAPLLPGPQRWVVHDRDADLLEGAAACPPGPAADGAAVTVETRVSDVTRLDAGDLADAGLVTASALLDILTEEEMGGIVAACARAGCPALLTLSVVGRVTLAPSDALDARLEAAFNAHQRRSTGRGRLLGPDAVAAAVTGFERRGARVLVEQSPWRLGAGESDLAAAWLEGWLGAAIEQEAGLAAEAETYARRRRAEIAEGGLSVTVGHADLLVLPRDSA